MDNSNSILYVLGGGFMKKAPDKGGAFYRAIIGDRKAANVLICCFGMPHDHWQAGYVDDRDRIISANPEVQLSFQVATLECFIEQVSWANVIIFKGGSTEVLIENLDKVGNWLDDLAGKTIVGSSAGAYILSSNYVVTSPIPQLASGLGLLPIVIAAHYRSTFIHNGDVNKSQTFWDNVDTMMKTQANGRDVITLGEGDFITLQRTNS